MIINNSYVFKIMIKLDKKVGISIGIFIVSILLLFDGVYSRKIIITYKEKCSSLQNDLTISEKNREKLLIGLLSESEILYRNLKIIDSKLNFTVFVISDGSCTSCVQRQVSFAEKYMKVTNCRIILVTSKNNFRRYKPYNRLNNVDVIESSSIIDFITNLGFSKSLVISCNNKFLPRRVLLSDNTDIIEDFFECNKVDL